MARRALPRHTTADMARMLLLGAAVVASLGCASGLDGRDMVGTSPESRGQAASRMGHERACVAAAYEEVEAGSVCGRYSRRDRSFDAREARRCAAFRCMQAKGYTLYEHEARTRGRW